MKESKSESHRKVTKVIDWTAINRHLEITRKNLEQGSSPSPEKMKKILKERAKALASEPAPKKVAADYIEIVEFILSDEKYGIESAFIREVCPLKDFTPLPGTPPFILGIINFRGQILSVTDLKKFFDLPEKGISDLNRLIIVYNDKMEFGILADAVIGVKKIALDEIQSTLPIFSDMRVQYLKGVTTERLIILDIDKILSDDKIFVHTEIM
ncbi:MAG: chemotaxis protein CheW [Candidatus Marinimicrobia bacterium]|nr:chemotaxis protein CheW [Candidatus Neomarinimicrobiota bacterium]